VTYPGFTPVGNATLVVANVLKCNKHSQISFPNPVLHCTMTSTAQLTYQVPYLSLSEPAAICPQFMPVQPH
jgi:hypothetical protein